jgi:predicted RNA-binding Zn-ribbon protein involved in translation (DUF1610 family)
MLKYEIIETCLKCGYKWIRQVAKPKKCPDCRSIVWYCFAGRKKAEDPIKIDVLPGQSMLYNFDKKTIREINKAQRKNPRLIAQARADGILVTNRQGGF